MSITVAVRSVSGPRTEAPSLTFEGSRIVLGRGSGSDVRLPDPSVSFRHATIRLSGNDYSVVDEGSTNGTWIGGVRLHPQSPRAVKSGDLVRVGRVWLELHLGQRTPTPDLGLATRDLAFALVQRAMDAVGDDTVAKVRVAEGPDIGDELHLVEEGRAYVIGRAETCDLPLADTDASREHAVVARRGGQILLRDLDSRNGVYLGDARLAPDRDVVWRPPTMARLGLTVLALDEPVSVALAQLEAVDDERMREDDLPPLPPLSFAAECAASSALVGGVPTSTEKGPPSRVPDARGPSLADLATGTADMPRAAPQKRGWAVTDLLVVTLALVVIGASVAGLVWVLR